MQEPAAPRSLPRTMTTLGEVVRARREELGLSQFDVVLRMGGSYTQGELSKLENGRTNIPHIDTLRALGTALEMPAGRLLKLSRWPGAAILPESLEEALAEAPTQMLDTIEAFVEFVTGDRHPKHLDEDELETIEMFIAFQKEMDRPD